MRDYLIRRLLLIIPTLLIVTIIIFFTVRLIPGDVIDLMVVTVSGEAGGSEEVVEAMRTEIAHKLGLDVPIHIQYVRWIGGILRGDLGKSLWMDIPVTDYLWQRLPISGELAILAMITALSIALPIGVYSAIRQDTGGDYIGRSFAIACISLPSFWLGTMVVVLPAFYLKWTPPLQYIPFVEDPLGNLGQFIIPAVILGMVTSGTTMRMTRTMMLEVLRQDYIRTAWAKGLSERIVITRHALKNAFIPVITIVGFHFSWLIGGSVIIENIFALPGLGALMIDALTKRDYTIISGLNVFMAVFVLLIILAVDITYGYLDPRVHYK